MITEEQRKKIESGNYVRVKTTATISDNFGASVATIEICMNADEFKRIVRSHRLKKREKAEGDKYGVLSGILKTFKSHSIELLTIPI